MYDDYQYSVFTLPFTQVGFEARVNINDLEAKVKSHVVELETCLQQVTLFVTLQVTLFVTSQETLFVIFIVIISLTLAQYF